MRRAQEVTPQKFLELILEKHPEEIYRRSSIGSFDWEYGSLWMKDDEQEFWFSYNCSAHAYPDLPELLLKLFKMEKWDSVGSAAVLCQPSDLLNSSSKETLPP